MINAVYELIAPRMFDVTYKELNIEDNLTVIRPLYMSICKADQRYYQGMRSAEILREKLPMALIHECVAEVVFDPTGSFNVGDKVVPVPTIPTEDDEIVSENYRRSSKFCSSGFDGFFRDYVGISPERLVKIPDDFNLQVASFTELISVCYHAVKRFDKFSHSRKNIIGVWGDGNVGFITSLIIKYMYPDSKLYVFGAVNEKLSYFTFADEVFHVDDVDDSIKIDHGFECVGGGGSQSAINQIIDCINPQGSIGIMGVSENFVGINTRMVLEKGLNIFGSSRSAKADFEGAVKLLCEHPELVRYFEYLVDEIAVIKNIPDMHRAFDDDFKRNFGKTVLKWEV